MLMTHRILSGIACLCLASCTVGPDHVKPDLTPQTPSKWRWQTAAPRDAEPRGEWWKVFRDSELNWLQTLALQANPDLQAAMARVDQARAGARISVSGWLPDIRLKSSAGREQTSANLPTPVPVPIPAAQIDSFSSVLDLAYEIDLWGKVRRSVESARATAEAAQASYHGALLTLTGDLAAQYFLLRSLDAEVASLQRTIDLREKGTALLAEKAKAGVTSETDLARAKTEVSTARADLADTRRQRQEAVNTLALLCGQPASNFSIAARPITSAAPPSIPAGVPAAVLERRPDIAAAERTLAARNAEIGVAKAAYFPSITLTGNAGFLSKDLNSLLSADSKVWSVGPGLSLPVSGLAVIGFNVKKATAAREEAAAKLRSAVLAAVHDVETSLTQMRHRADQAKAVNDALASATQATDLVRAAYESGTVSYLELLDAERTRLQMELTASRVAAQRHLATVRLIKALGGGW